MIYGLVNAKCRAETVLQLRLLGRAGISLFLGLSLRLGLGLVNLLPYLVFRP